MIKEYFPERLKSARQMRGLSLRELVDLTSGKVSRQSISQYENGAMLPTRDNMLHLCEALEVTPEFFNRPAIVLQEVEFRKLAKLPIKEQNRIESSSADFLGRYLELETLLGEEQRFDNPIGHIKINTYHDVEKAAMELRQHWKLGENPLPNVIEMLEDFGLKVFEVAAKSSFSGMAAEIKDTDGVALIVINNNPEVEKVRKRFTALHELAHVLLDISIDIDEKTKEKFCHYFASVMLIPSEVLEQELGGKRQRLHVGELLAIKEQYGISMQAILYRSKQMGLISDYLFQQKMREFTRRKWRKKEPGDFAGKEQSHRMLQLLYRGVVEEIISTSKAANLYGTNLATFRKILNQPFNA
ncbi:MAG: XRE family transcriptional regulator [Bacteroidota bacterium]